MMKMSSLLGLMVSCSLLSGCFTRIESGETGIRVNASKEVQGTELMPGSWNQTVIGDVLTFPTRDLVVNLENKNPLTSDNSALADFDVSVVYSINPTSVADIYIKKSRSFHYTDQKSGEVLLMANYINTLVNNASYKAVRKYKSLELADNRAVIEDDIRATVLEQLKEEKLDSAISLTVVQVRSIKPNAEILKSATDFVKAQNELRVKNTEVEIAKKESERMAALAQNSERSIAYMQAQADLMIAQGIKDGRVQTIVVPRDFRGIITTGK